MLREVKIRHAGKLYTAQLDAGATASGDAPPLPGRGRWHVTLGPTAITSFEARPDDTAERVRERVLDWLDAQADLSDRDQVHLGGG